MKNLFTFLLAIIAIVFIVSCSKKQNPTTVVETNNEIVNNEDTVKPKPTITPGQKIHSSQTIKLNPEQINKLKQMQQSQPNNNSNPNVLPGSTNPVAPTPENSKTTKPQ
jgi:hypothetical protein